MLTNKEAVAKAVEYMQGIYGSPDGLLVEEIELDTQNRVWRVTMGFWLPLPPQRGGLADVLEPRRVKRTYKALEISVDSGEVLSMKIREIKE